MVDVGERAPEFTAPLATGDVGEFDLADRLDDAPLVLVFFPAAFTGVCTHEMETFEERLSEFESAGASVFGVSVDLPFALNAFREEHGLTFGMISDTNRRLVEAFDVAMDFVSMGIDDVAKRAVFVVDEEGIVTYAWVSDDPSIEPDYDAVYEAAEEAA